MFKERKIPTIIFILSIVAITCFSLNVNAASRCNDALAPPPDAVRVENRIVNAWAKFRTSKKTVQKVSTKLDLIEEAIGFSLTPYIEQKNSFVLRRKLYDLLKSVDPITGIRTSQVQELSKLIFDYTWGKADRYWFAAGIQGNKFALEATIARLDVEKIFLDTLITTTKNDGSLNETGFRAKLEALSNSIAGQLFSITLGNLPLLTGALPIPTYFPENVPNNLPPRLKIAYGGARKWYNGLILAFFLSQGVVDAAKADMYIDPEQQALADRYFDEQIKALKRETELAQERRKHSSVKDEIFETWLEQQTEKSGHRPNPTDTEYQSMHRLIFGY